MYLSGVIKIVHSSNRPTLCFLKSCKEGDVVKGIHKILLLQYTGAVYIVQYKHGGLCVCVCLCVYMCMYIYRVSQEECARIREGVPYVKVYRYNPKHLCPKLNGYGDNGQRSLKL